MFEHILKALEWREYPSWAEMVEKIVIANGPFPGLFDLSRTPWHKQMLEDLDNPDIKLISFVTGAQLAKTQNNINNGLIWTIKNNVPVYFIAPTKDVCANIFANTVVPIVENTQMFKDLLIKDPSTGRVSRKTYKGLSVRFYGGGSFSLVHASARLALQQKTTSLIIIDEYDKCLQYWPKTNSDMLTNADRRVSAFAGKNRKILIGSTPTYKGFGIEALREDSTKKIFRCKCPKCSEFFAPTFYNLYFENYPKDNLTELQIREQVKKLNSKSRLYLKCPHCSHEIESWAKPLIVSGAEWSDVDNSGSTTSRVSYASSGLFGFSAWWEVYLSWLEARLKPEKYRGFKNEVMGEAFEERQLPHLKLTDLVRGNHIRGAEKDVLGIATGVDVQPKQKLIYFSVVGFRKQDEYSLIQWGHIPFKDYEDLEEIIKKLHYSNYNGFNNNYTFVDSGADASAIVPICKRISYHNCLALKGNGKNKSDVYRYPSTLENYHPVLVHPHTTNKLLDEYIRNGSLLFPADFDDMTYFNHIKNEIEKIEKGKFIYDRISSSAEIDYRDSLRYSIHCGKYYQLGSKKNGWSFGW